MSYYTALSLVTMGDATTIPAPPDQQLQVTGIPAGHWINFVTWAKDGRTIAFTTRSAGERVGAWGVRARERGCPTLIALRV